MQIEDKIYIKCGKNKKEEDKLITNLLFFSLENKNYYINIQKDTNIFLGELNEKDMIVLKEENGTNKEYYLLTNEDKIAYVELYNFDEIVDIYIIDGLQELLNNFIKNKNLKLPFFINKTYFNKNLKKKFDKIFEIVNKLEKRNF